jgi:hypothetical protein
MRADVTKPMGTGEGYHDGRGPADVIGRKGAAMAQPSVPRVGRPAGPGPGVKAGTGADTAVAAAGLARFDRRVIVAGGVVFAVLMVLSPWYGFHRDELYFLDCARHLQASYVDQPVLTPLLAWVSLKLFGVSLTGLRLWPALAAVATATMPANLGRNDGLPTAVSDDNNEWWWGPGNPRATTVIAVANGPAGGGTGTAMAEFFTSVETVATLSNPAGIHNQEWGGHIHLCTGGPTMPWAQLWPLLRHYG